MYRAIVERSAEKVLKRAFLGDSSPCGDCDPGSGQKPTSSGSRKLVGTENDWRIRVGDYRIVYEIADEIRIVRINRVRHRRDVYR